MQTYLKHKSLILLVVLIIIGAFLHFYNLNWGSPFYFHPDERNIASSVSQLIFLQQMNPHFFAYGSFPIYVIYFTGLFLNIIFNLPILFTSQRFPLENKVGFEQAILISRFLSALLSTGIILLSYFIGKKLKNEICGIITAIFTTFSVGLIQFAHFGTFEMWTTFFSLSLFYLCIKEVKKEIYFIILAGIITGFLAAIKIANIPLFLIPCLILLINSLKIESKSKNSFYYKYIDRFAIVLKKSFFLFFIAFIIFLLNNPFVIFDFNSFYSTIKYESSLGIGALPAFYTEEFFNTIPLFFQFINIYPFILNPILTILFIPSFVYLLFVSFKRKNILYLILLASYLILFLPNAFIFTKWTRYIIPTLPFIYLILAICLTDIFNKSNNKNYYKYIGISVVFISITFTASYFITAFVKNDTRVSAALWAKENLPNNSKILAEVYDLGIIPFNSNFPNIKLFNFYNLDNNLNEENLNDLLFQADYLILPSQRIFKTRLINKNQFPIGNSFYKSLFDGKTEFKKIYETPCDLFCKIVYLNNPVFSFEQTTNVFDRPTIMIFKKLKVQN